MSNGVALETNGVHNDAQQEGIDDGLRRRNSIERYRPGAHFNEEREKLRARAHFGERRLENKENRTNGHRRGNRGRGSGGQRGGQRGSGGNFHSYRNGTKREDDFDEDQSQTSFKSHEVEAAPPPPIGNWADELSDDEAAPKKSEPEVRDLRDKLNSMKMDGSNRSNEETQNQRFQKPRNGDRQNGHGDRQNGHGDRQTGRGDRHNGYGDRQNGHGDRQNGHGDRQNGHGDRHNGFGDRQNGHGDRHNGFGDRQNGHGDRYNGHGDRLNGYGDQKYNRNKQNRNQPHPQHQKACQSSLPLPKKNTVNFDPSHEPPQMRIIAAEPALKKYNRRYGTRDVVVASDIFCQSDDLTIYNKLLDEIEHSGVDIQKLWQLWHGDSHVIADDHLGQWKEKCPTFSWVVEKMASYFDMDVKATRLNWYRDSTEWKPFHHDAAAMKEKFARTQNFTLAVSFGAERDVAFEHAQTKTIISMPQPNGSVYTFGRDVNIIWRHGIPQLAPEFQSDDGRISIIAWGWIDMDEV